MDSRRFVVSSAASCLFSWRLAVFIFHWCAWGSAWGLPLLGCGLCEDWLVSAQLVGDPCVLGASLDRNAERLQGCLA